MQAYRLFRSQSYRVCPIRMDRRGMDTRLLEESRADIAYVTPSHQYPTGIVHAYPPADGAAGLGGGEKRQVYCGGRL